MTAPLFEAVASYCSDCLFENEEMLGQLKDERRLSEDTIREFGLGLFPTDMRGMFKETPATDLREAGIIRNAVSSLFHTWPLVMPIRDASGKAVALAGRCLLPEEERKERGIPKYMNTVYFKTHHLFGLHRAKRAILESGTAHVVEGYFDVMLAHQEGLLNTVACCGVALSRRHISLLARYAKKVVLLFDNDKEGQKSAEKTLELRRCDEVDLTSLSPFPKGEDLCDFLSKRSLSEFLSSLQAAEGYARL